jgi:hypothetical protein
MMRRRGARPTATKSRSEDEYGTAAMVSTSVTKRSYHASPEIVSVVRAKQSKYRNAFAAVLVAREHGRIVVVPPPNR